MIPKEIHPLLMFMPNLFLLRIHLHHGLTDTLYPLILQLCKLLNHFNVIGMLNTTPPPKLPILSTLLRISLNHLLPIYFNFPLMSIKLCLPHPIKIDLITPIQLSIVGTHQFDIICLQPKFTGLHFKLLH